MCMCTHWGSLAESQPGIAAAAAADVSAVADPLCSVVARKKKGR